MNSCVITYNTFTVKVPCTLQVRFPVQCALVLLNVPIGIVSFLCDRMLQHITCQHLERASVSVFSQDLCYVAGFKYMQV